MYKFINEHGAVKVFPFDADVYKDCDGTHWKRLRDSDISPKPTSAISEQVGGSHYKNMAMQPVAFIQQNKIPYIEGCCIKYLCRWREKNGIEDLKKARHYLDMLIEMEGKKDV